MERGEHADLLDAGIAADGRAFRALLDGRGDEGRAALARRPPSTAPRGRSPRRAATGAWWRT